MSGLRRAAARAWGPPRALRAFSARPRDRVSAEGLPIEGRCRPRAGIVNPG